MGRVLVMKGVVQVSSAVWVRGKGAEQDSRMRGMMKRGVQRLCLLLVWWR